MHPGFANKLVALKTLPAGVERDMQLFKWKHEHWTEKKIFSTLHGGDCTGNVIRALEEGTKWEDTVVIEGKKLILEYERNFNEFITWLQK